MLRSGAEAYFTEQSIHKQANTGMKIKLVVMLGLYAIPYFFILGELYTGLLSFLCLWVIMAAGMTGVGAGIMHDANHGALARENRQNHWMGKIICLLGVDQLNWKIQHNILHHTYTNIEGHDDSLHGGKLLRFSPHQPWLPHHRYQQFYAWFLYPLQTVVWFLVTDFVRLRHYRKTGMLPDQGKHYARLWAELLGWKCVYALCLLIIPMVCISAPWWWVVAGFLLMQCITGFFLSLVFLCSHIVPLCNYPLPDKGNRMESHWLVHEMHTSANYAMCGKWFTWFVGGLNFQVEHHLFPHVCHVHYPALSVLVKDAAEKYGVPYNSYRYFSTAIRAHARMLKSLGKPA
ncbi:MAG: acyl-CoA desaturase [Bacteroidetes bacterium]|nr:acyl-CoA desaturase [Bacteroidota bacterium]